MSGTDVEDVVGVIAARFQVPELHEGHRHTIEMVLKNHKTVLFILGVAYTSTDKDPLPFEMRVMMIKSAYPNTECIFVPSPSLTSSKLRRSQILDDLIASTIRDRQAILYGARDSIVHNYVGVYEKVELPTITTTSATVIRNSTEAINSVDFRKGVIWGAVNRKPISYPTVDVAIVQRNISEVLLVGWKEDEGKLRFPGSFFLSELDQSFEDTGIRCIAKEIPGITIGRPQLIASKKIFDRRYRKTKDGIVTTLMMTNYGGGKIEVGEGVDSVQWVDFNKVPEVLVEAHQPLGEIMQNRWYG